MFLGNAPWSFCKYVIRQLKSIGFVQHTLDPMFFIKRVAHKIVALLLVHVDDVLGS